jgi:hypothetical protein
MTKDTEVPDRDGEMEAAMAKITDAEFLAAARQDLQEQERSVPPRFLGANTVQMIAKTPERVPFHALKLREGDQPLPVPNDEPDEMAADDPATIYALKQVFDAVDHDLHKQIECDEETGEDGYPALAEAFVEARRYYASDETEPFDPGTGPWPGYVAGRCGHRVAESEWRAGFRVCERCS